MTYLRVKNWSRFQHYAKRRPPWIKLYNDLIGDGDDFEHLPEQDQWQLVRIWMFASKSSRCTLDGDGKTVPVIPNDEQTIRRSIQTLKKVPLARLIRDGWLIVVAEAALIAPDASPVLAPVLANGREKEPESGPDASALLEPENHKEPRAVSGVRVRADLTVVESEQPRAFEIPATLVREMP